MPCRGGLSGGMEWARPVRSGFGSGVHQAIAALMVLFVIHDGEESCEKAAGWLDGLGSCLGIFRAGISGLESCASENGVIRFEV